MLWSVLATSAIVLATRRNVVKRGELGSLVFNGGNYGGRCVCGRSLV